MKKHEYYLIGTAEATNAVATSHEEAVQIVSSLTSYDEEICWMRKITLEEAVQEQLKWEAGDLEWAASVYEKAAEWAKEDLEAEDK